MAKRRVTVDTDHLTIVVAKTLFGTRRHIRIVSDYQGGLEEIVLTSQRYKDVDVAEQTAKRFSKQFGIKSIVVE